MDRLLTDEYVLGLLMGIIESDQSLGDIFDKIGKTMKWMVKTQDTKTANHYETVIIPARIAEAVKAERERVIKEIESKMTPQMQYGEQYGWRISWKAWQQLKQEG